MMATVDHTPSPALLVLLLAVFLSFMPLKGAAADAVDHALFAELLAKYVRGGEVDYAGFKSEEKTLDRYLFLLEQTDPGSLGRDDQFAFYINAYNAWTIKLILTGYPGLKSIKDLGTLFQSPWKKMIVRIHGETLSLDDVEHKILRPRFKDPRVHFAINCASTGCPPLISEPYRGAALSEQLDKVTREFLNAPQNYRLEGDTFWVSALFKWFPEDFDNDPAGFYRGYAEGDLKRLLEEKRDRLRLRYLDYDWSLNGA